MLFGCTPDSIKPTMLLVHESIIGKDHHLANANLMLNYDRFHNLANWNLYIKNYRMSGGGTQLYLAPSDSFSMIGYIDRPVDSNTIRLDTSGIELTISVDDHLEINGDPGMPGEVIISKGVDNAPQWADINLLIVRDPDWGVNIYNTSDTFTNNRIAELNNRTLTFTEAGSPMLHLWPLLDRVGFGTTVPSADVALVKSKDADIVTLDVRNTSNTAFSAAYAKIGVAGSLSDDPYVVYNVSGAQDWATGIDNSASDRFVIAASSNLTSTHMLEIATDGQLVLNEYGVGNFVDIDNDYILSVDAAGNVQEMDSLALYNWLGITTGGANTNYAEDDLTADGTHGHFWNTFSLSEIYTTGNYIMSNNGSPTAFVMDGDSANIIIGGYGLGNRVMGTPTFNLAVDSAGNIVETSLIGGTGGDNLYNISDTLTSARVVTHNGNSLLFDNGTHYVSLDNTGVGTQIGYDSGAGKTSSFQVNTIGTLFIKSSQSSDQNNIALTPFNTTFSANDAGRTNIFLFSPARADFKKQFALSGSVSPAAMASTEDDYAPTFIDESSHITYNCAVGGTSLTGLSANQAGGTIMTFDVVNDTLWFEHEGLSSTAANRYDLPKDATLFVVPGGTGVQRYKAGLNRWQILSFNNGN